jgi:hypothetical protein
MGQLMLSRMLQFYTAPRVARITNKEGQPEFIEFFVQNIDDRKVFNFRRSMKDQGTLVTMPNQAIEVKGAPDVRVTTGSSLPFAKAQKTTVAKDLFSAGAIDQRALLDAVQWPGAEEIIQRMSKAAQELAMQPQATK